MRGYIDKIRKRYADFSVEFTKGTHALRAFEDRYIQALRRRMDMATFLHVEMTVVEDLIKTEKEKLIKAANREIKTKEKQEEKKDFADRVIEENRRRIAKYPPIHIHKHASEDVERLYGTLSAISSQFWADIESFIRKSYPSAINNPRRRLEERILALCDTMHGGLPTRVSRYKSLFDWKAPDSPEIVKEERKVLLDAAFFLYDLTDVFAEMLNSPNLEPWEHESVEKMRRYVHTVIEDFRMREFRSLRQ